MFLNRIILIVLVLCSKYVCSQCDHDIIITSEICSGNYEVDYPVVFSTEGPTNGDAYWNIGNGLYEEEMIWWQVDDFTIEFTFQDAGEYLIYFSYENASNCFFEDSLTIDVVESSFTHFVPNYLDSNPEWCTTRHIEEFENGPICSSKRYYYINGDTVFNDETFKILFANGVDYGCGSVDYIDPYIETYMRQDGEIIYRHYPEQDTTIVMFDFSLQVGDTVPPGGLYSDLWEGDQLFPEEEGVFTISEIDSVCFNGNFYKVFTFSPPYPFGWNHSILEGVGHLYGLLYPFRDIGESEFMGLDIFKIGDEYFVGGSNYNCEVYVGEEEFVLDNEFTLYPNPSSGIIRLEGLDEIEYDLRIFSSTGKLVYAKRKLFGRAELLLDLEKGIYLIRLETEGGVSKSKKLILQ